MAQKPARSSRVAVGFALGLILALPARGQAANPKWSMALLYRLMSHYNQEELPATPPKTNLAEVQLIYRKSSVDYYIQFGKSVAAAPTTAFGLGLKYNFLDIGNAKNSFPSRVNLQILVDMTEYSTRPPVPPQTYKASELIFRYGGAIQWWFKSGKVYFETSVLVSRVSNNFFIAPGLGFGLILK